MAPLIINRTNDALFKNIFANKKHKNITLSLINSVLEFEGTAQVQDIDFLDREVNGENDTDKDSRLDFLGVCSDGTKINVEIQIAKLEAIAMTEPMIQEALKAEVLFKQDKAAWWEYEKAEKIRRDKLAQINYAKKQGKVEDIKNLMDSCKWTVEQAMAALKIPKDDYPEYIALM